jgi:hypothetical protein
MTDTDHGTRRIHCNSNNIGFLNSSGSWGSYSPDNGDWRTDFISYAGASMRAPIFYDSNNTTYYTNPGATSSILDITLKGKINFPTSGLGTYARGSQSYNIYQESGAWTSPFPDLNIGFHTGISIGAHATYNGMRFFDDYTMATQVMSINNSADPLGANNVYVTNGLQAGSSLRAPIFYDSNNTGYYTDPASTSNMNVVTVAGDLRGAEVYTSGWFRNDSATEGMYNQQSGNHWYSTNDGYWNVGYSGTQGIRFRNGHNGTVLGAVYAETNGYFGLLDNTGNWAVRIQPSNNPLELRVGNNLVFSVYTGYTTTAGSSRAPIFYDRDNTSYYTNPASTSNLNSLSLVTLNATTANIGTLNVSGNTTLGNGNGDVTHINDVLHIGATDSGNADFFFGEGSTNAIAYGAHWHWDSGYTFTWNTRNNNTDTALMRYMTNDTSAVDWYRAFDMNGSKITSLGTPTAAADAATKAYVDTAVSPIGNYLPLAGGTMTGTLDMGSGNIAVDNDKGFVNSGAWNTMTTAYGNIQLGPANSGHAHIYTNISNFYFNKMIQVLGGSQMNQNDMRAGIFYDINNTGYYTNPASTSNMNIVTAVGFNGPLTGTASYAANAGLLDGVDSGEFIRSNTGDSFSATLTMATQKALVAADYGGGVYGLYSASRFQHLWSMGTAYNLAPNGTTTGNLYGVTWSHPNAGGAAANLNDHGMMVLTNGGWLASISSSIRCSSDMRTPIYYDLDNSAYYTNPASTSNMNVVNANTFNGAFVGNLNGTASAATQAANLGGVVPTQIVYGGAGRKSTQRNTFSSNTEASGFYYGNNMSGAPTTDWANYIQSAGNSWQSSNNYSFQLTHAFHSDNFWVSRMTNGSASTARLILDAGGGHQTKSGILQSNASLRAPYFYDSTNTAYYVRPASGSYISSLTTAGNVTIGASNASNLYLGAGGGTHMRIHTSGGNSYFDLNNGNLNWRNGSSTRFIFYNVTANMTVYGTVTQYSDERHKENIVEIGNCIDKIKSIRGVYYNRTDLNTETTKIGVIAQEVEVLMPELVLEEPETGFKSVAYSELTAVLVNGMKEQQAIIEDLKARLEILENK